MKTSLALLEITGFGASLVALDALDKAADVQLLQTELNDFYGVCIKITGSPAALATAIEAAGRLVEKMGGETIASVMNAPDDRAWPAIVAKPEFNPLLEAHVVIFPNKSANTSLPSVRKDPAMTKQQVHAIGLIETQGFIAVFEAIDTACKAANVEVIGKEKLGGGYVTVLIRGDVAAVRAAIDAGTAKVEGLGKLIAAHVIPRPSDSVLALITQT